MSKSLLPSFDELPEIPGLGLRHAWDIYGPDDVLGTINLVTPARVAEAAAGVRTGEMVSLDMPLDLPDPPLFERGHYTHEIYPLNRHEMDDRLIGFQPQGSTQWDALSHVRCREFGFWGGRTTNPSVERNDLGIEHWAEHGVAGRGVLVDVAGWREAQGRPFDALTPEIIPADELAAVLDAQSVELREGDILCLRTGWVGAYQALDAAGRQHYADGPRAAGLAADEAVARFLWNAHPAALCCDNPAVEVVPGDPAVGSLHRRLLPLLGFALGEMFDFETLAERCRAAGNWTFFFVAVPLRLPRGLGSPGNAVAIL